MTGAQFDFHDLLLIPLTPVHVGGGEEAKLHPEDYRLSADGHVERISVRAVLARLEPAMRANFLKQFGSSPELFIGELQKRANGDDVLERILISPESAKSVDLGGKGHGRRNQIDAFYRSGGTPVLPGSSLKGALRTAWLRALWDTQSVGTARFAMPDRLEWSRMPRGQRSRGAQTLVRNLFGLAGDKSATDTDPMRDVVVADAPLPANATRIDKVSAWKKGKDGYDFDPTGEIHRERLRAVTDGGAPPLVPIRIGLRLGIVRDGRRKLDPDAKLHSRHAPDSIGVMLAALETQHRSLWDRELERFFPGPAGERMRSAIGPFGKFSREGASPEAALIRLGWGGHAEAKSLAPVRLIERPQARGDGKFATEGSARHIVDLEGHPVPFGWALLIRLDAWEKDPVVRFLEPPVQKARPQTKAGGTGKPQVAAGRGDTALGGQVRYPKGSKLLVGGEVMILDEDVTHAHKPTDEVNALYDGDREPIRVRDIEGPA
jgi:hypothetical protein